MIATTTRTLRWLRTQRACAGRTLLGPTVGTLFDPHAVAVAVAVLVTAILDAAPVQSADRYALVITGASAGPAYAEKYDKWRNSLVTTLNQKFRYPDDHLFVLAETEGPNVARSTRENVRAVMDRVGPKVGADDLLFVILIGHGTTADDDEAKFNLVGPDLKAGEWADMLAPIAGRVVFVDTTGGSFPFLRRLSAPRRIVVSATDSAAQQFETVFAEFFVSALDGPAADLDKNGRVSIWEAFSVASAAVRQWYEQHGQLPTERALLDDNGDGVGREAQSPGPDGAVARAVYLAPETPAAGDSVLGRRREDLERQLDNLRVRKASSTEPGQFDAEIEKILLEIAQLSRQLR
jgi:hypothetical protein